MTYKGYKWIYKGYKWICKGYKWIDKITYRLRVCQFTCLNHGL